MWLEEDSGSRLDHVSRDAGKKLNISLVQLKSIRPDNILAPSLGEPEISSTYFFTRVPLPIIVLIGLVQKSVSQPRKQRPPKAPKVEM